MPCPPCGSRVERTQAICGAAFLEGEQWGALDGALVITALKGSKLLVLTLADDGSVEEVAVPEETDGPFGRLRAARLGPGCPVRHDDQRRRRPAPADHPPHLTGPAAEG